MNKADSMDPAELLKVNSALTWALSRILRSPEPRRIYTGSFWDQPLKPTYLSELFEKESASLLCEWSSIFPSGSSLRNDEDMSRALCPGRVAAAFDMASVDWLSTFVKLVALFFSWATPF